MGASEIKNLPVVIGSGGGKGGGGGTQRAAVEDPDSLRSISYAYLIDALSEGEIGGLVAGMQSIYLDGTPVQAADGAMNFQNVGWGEAKGTQAQGMLGGRNDSLSTVQYNQQVLNGSPVVRSVTSGVATALRVAILIPALYTQDTSTGDIHGGSVQYMVEYQPNGGSYIPVTLGSAATSEYGTGSSTATTPGGTTSFDGTVIAASGEGNVRVQYQPTGGGSWTDVASGYVALGEFETYYDDGGAYTTGNRLPSTSFHFSLGGLSGSYNLRIVVDSGTAAPQFTGLTSQVANSVVTVTGKASSAYVREHEFQLTGASPWNVRVTRVSANDGGNFTGKTYLQSITEVVQTKLRYPNTACILFVIDAKQFQSIPTRGYDIRGLKVKVPSNYNPETRVYTGSWDGTFTVAWTDNPAWCFYDMLTNTRYGLGNYIPAASVDKWALYTIAQYCDQLVPDGFGGTERRFSCNLYLQEREEAFTVVNNMASIFRGMTYWGNGAITAVQDSPSDPVASFAPANVVDGIFEYQGSSLKTRHTVAIVVWNDPVEYYRQKREYVADTAGIALYGVRETEIVAVGCATRGQAHRVGKWLLQSERLETESVQFKVGLEGAQIRPGSVIRISDPSRTGSRMGGRVSIGSTTSTIQIDSPVTLLAGHTYTLHCLKSDGTVMSSTITNFLPSNPTAIALNTAYSEIPAQDTVWLLEANDAAPTQWRVLGIAEADKHLYDVFAISHYAGKYASVESDVILAVPPISSLRFMPSSPTNIVVSESLYVAGQTVRVRVGVAWDSVPTASQYIIRMRRNSGPWEQLPLTDGPTIDVNDCAEGLFEFYIGSITPDGAKSPEAYASYTVIGKTAPPANVTGFNYTKQKNGLLLYWSAVADLDLDYYEIRVGASWAAGVTIYKGATLDKLYDQLAASSYTFWIKAKDTSGNESTAATSLAVTVVVPSTLSPSASFSDIDYLLQWATPSSDWTLDYYEIRYGGAWIGSTLLANVSATNYRAAVDFSGSRTFWVAAHDVAGNVGTAASVALTVTPAAAPTVTRVFSGTDVNIAWNAVTGALPTRAYEIRYGSDFASGTYVANVTALSRSMPVSWTGSRTFWVAAIDSSGAYGTAGSVAVLPTPWPAPAVSSSVIGVKAALSWTQGTAADTMPLDHYEVRYGASWAAGALVTVVSSDNYRVPITWTGDRDFYVAAVDSAGNYGTASSFSRVTVNAPSAPSVTAAFLLDQAVVTWSAPSATLPIVEYEIRYGASGSTWAANASTSNKIKATRLEVKAQWLGDRVYFVAAIDANGNLGAVGQVTMTVTAPGQPYVTSQVVDNNVLLYWTLPTSTLPIIEYEVRRGATWAGGTVIGTKAGLFTSVFEVVSGSYTYWLAGKDSAGNYGTPGSVATSVTQPPDYVLKADYDSTFSGTLSNALFEQGTVLMPVEVGRTWAQHFTDNGWTTIAGQTGAGYPLYIQPNVASGYYQENIDYGTILPGTKVSVSYNTTAISGSPTISCRISLSPDNSAWTDYDGVTSVFGVGFRYIRVRITVTRAANTDLVRLNTLNVRLDSKLVSDAGMVVCYAPVTGATYSQTGTSLVVTSTAHGRQVGDWANLDFTSGTAADGVYQITAKDANTFTVTAASATTSGNVNIDTTGSAVKFAQTFTDVSAITVTPQGTTQISAIYDFTDVPNPTEFKVYVFNSGGTRIAGTVSWQAKGY
ncbi:Tip attachment protein J [uncultured Caudovirales phage]|uniref:Tip attachment protein J n=1 Tax=uncultured Caudovirales phage TaxID=2100421 RepID=A0A6J5QAG7_9CAUD|nr:Tip attachment protein J [uncultured Caudovirales phage]